VAETKGKLRLFYLPPYSPELNPDELVWNFCLKIALPSLSWLLPEIADRVQINFGVGQ